MGKVAENTIMKLLSASVLIACLLLLASCGGAAHSGGSEGGLGGVSSKRSEENVAGESSGAPVEPAPVSTGNGASASLEPKGNGTDAHSGSADNDNRFSSEPEDDGVDGSIETSAEPVNDAADASSSTADASSVKPELPIANGDEACEYVRACLEYSGKNIPPIIECFGMNGECYKVHGYSLVEDAAGGHTATQFWYDVEPDGVIFDTGKLTVIDPETMEPYDPREATPFSEFEAPSNGEYSCKLGTQSLDAWVSDGYLMLVGEAYYYPYDGTDGKSSDVVMLHHAFPLDGAVIFSDAEPSVEGPEELAQFLPEGYPCSMEIAVEHGDVTLVRIHD